MKLARIVVAHTPTAERRIVTRYGGRVVTIDTGMLAYCHRACPARSKSSGIVWAIYPDGEVELTPAKAAQMSVPAGAPSRTHASRPAALATAKLMP